MGEGSYLDEPCQEEDEGDEVEIRAPAGEAINGSVHEEHPSLLGRRLVHRENAGSWRVEGGRGHTRVRQEGRHKQRRGLDVLLHRRGVCMPGLGSEDNGNVYGTVVEALDCRSRVGQRSNQPLSVVFEKSEMNTLYNITTCKASSADH